MLNLVQAALAVIALSGIALGLLSSLSPDRSIRLYQWMMKYFNWKVEPLDYARELGNTRRLGALMLVLSFAILAILLGVIPLPPAS